MLHEATEMSEQVVLMGACSCLNGALDQCADVVYVEMIHQKTVSQNSEMNGWT